MTTRTSTAACAIPERLPDSSRRGAIASAPPASERGYTILVAACEDEQAGLVTAGLTGLEGVQTCRVGDADAIAAHLGRAEADAAIIVADRPDLHVIATLRAIDAVRPLPVALFVAHADKHQIEFAIGAGASALVVDGLLADRIVPVLQVARSRFAANAALRTELARTKSDLAARKTIERAKGILMERRRLSEAEAYAMLRRSAMQGGKTIAEIAEAIMAADRLLTA